MENLRVQCLLVLLSCVLAFEAAAEDTYEPIDLDLPRPIPHLYRDGAALIGISNRAQMFESLDDGITWTRRENAFRDFDATSVLKIGDTLYYAADDSVSQLVGACALHVSFDHGSTAELRAHLFDQDVDARLAFGGGRLFVWARTLGRLMVSEDFGYTFQDVPPPPGGAPLRLPIFFGDSTAVALDNQGRLYRTVNAGRTWSSVPGVPMIELPDAYDPTFRLLSSTSGVLFTRTGQPLHTDDAGASWKTLEIELPNGYTSARVTDYYATGHGVVMVLHGSSGRVVAVSTNAQAFTVLPIERCFRDPGSGALHVAGDVVFFNRGDACYRITFEPSPLLEILDLRDPVGINALAVQGCTSIAAIGRYANTVITPNAGEEICESSVTCAANFRSVAWQSEHVVFMAAKKEYTQCSTGCLVRIDVRTPDVLEYITPPLSDFPPLEKVMFLDERRGYLLSSNDLMYTSTDGGATWLEINLVEKVFLSGFKDFTVTPDGAIWAVLNHQTYAGSSICVSRDNGETWSYDENISGVFTYKLVPTSSGGVVAASLNGFVLHLMYYDPSTQQWTERDSMRLQAPVFGLAYNENLDQFCLAVDRKIIIASSDMTPQRTIWAPDLNAGRGLYSDGCEGYLLWLRDVGMVRFTPDPVLVSNVDDDSPVEVPEPPVPITSMRWYDLTGREVDDAFRGPVIERSGYADGSFTTRLLLRASTR